MTGTPITWVEVMELVRALEAQRRAGEHLTKEDAERLVTMLVAFHEGVVCALPTSETRPERVERAAGSGRL
jgi:hypothetical protein